MHGQADFFKTDVFYDFCHKESSKGNKTYSWKIGWLLDLKRLCIGYLIWIPLGFGTRGNSFRTICRVDLPF